MRLGLRRGQSTAEYATLLVIIIGAITVMQLFLKRGMNAGIAHATKEHFLNAGTGSSGLAGTAQFEPYYSTSHIDTTVTSDKTKRIMGGGAYYMNSFTNVTSSGWRNQEAVTGHEEESSWGWNYTLDDLRTSP